MKGIFNWPDLGQKNLKIILILILIGIGISPIIRGRNSEIKAGMNGSVFDWNQIPEYAIFQQNSLLAIANPNNPPKKVIGKVKVVVTAYSSTYWETDDNPFITAAGTKVKEGIVANNLLPFGTKVRIPEIYGDKIFVVEDRMNRKKGKYQIDIWFSDYWQALSFGAKRTYIEILES